MAHKHMKIGSTLLFKCKLKPQCDTTKYVLECKKKKKTQKTFCWKCGATERK